MQKNNLGTYDTNASNYSSDFNKKVREYTEDFFKTRTLVVCTFYESHYAGALKIDSVEVNKNTVNVNIKRPESTIANTVEVNWEFLVEVEKTAVSPATNYTYTTFVK